MVVSNDTLTIINYAKDVDYEFNIKLLLFTFFLISALISLYVAYKDKYETETKTIYNYLLFGYGWLVIFFLPIYMFFLERTVPLTTILNYISIFYTIIFSIGLVLGLIYIIERGLKYFFDISITDKKTKHRDKTEYRQVERD